MTTETGTPFVWPIRVYYEDTDSGGVVYYANYLRFMERARTEFLRSLGFEQDVLRNDRGLIFAVSEVNIRYRKPAVFNDALEVHSTITDIGRASLSFDQKIIRSDTESLTTAFVRIACIDAEAFSVCPIPDDLSRTLRECIG